MKCVARGAYGQANKLYQIKGAGGMETSHKSGDSVMCLLYPAVSER